MLKMNKNDLKCFKWSNMIRYDFKHIYICNKNKTWKIYRMITTLQKIRTLPDNPLHNLHWHMHKRVWLRLAWLKINVMRFYRHVKIHMLTNNMLLFTTNRLVKICYWRLKSIEHIMFATKNCLSDVVCEGWQFDLLFIFDCSVTHR